MSNVLWAVTLFVANGVRVVVALAVGVSVGLLVAPVVAQGALGHLDMPTSLTDVTASYAADSWTGTGGGPSLGTALGSGPGDVATYDQTFDHPFAVLDRLDELGALLQGSAYP